MKLLLFFLRYSPRLLSFAFLLGLIGGGATAALMALINEKLGGGSSLATVWAFTGLVLLVLLANYASRLVMLHFSQRVIYDMRMDLCRQVSAVPLRSVEEIGGSRIFAVLSEDINNVTAMVINMPSVLVNLSILAGCLVYLGWLSLPLLSGFLVFLALAVATTKLPEKRAFHFIRRSRECWDALTSHFRALTDGLKELQLHQPRRRAFFAGPLESAAVGYRENRIAGAKVYAATASWSQVLLFVFLGIALYGAPLAADMERRTLTAFVLTAIYLRGPIVILLDLAPLFTQARVSLKKVEDLGLSLTRLGGDRPASPLPPPAPCERIDLVALVHGYYREQEDRSFLLGPIDLTIHRGELIFLVGGNGSGKTTLIKLLTALYLPESGEIRYNGEPIVEENREWYRQHFTVVFYDFFLFNSLLGLENAPELDTAAQAYLKRLQLDHKVRVVDGELSTTQLSQGQRKRLALLTAYLEDRPIYVFDEWAADQDPVFKDVFYLELLPELRARGKTVVVVSHDDRYYHLADRVLKLDSGNLVQDYAPAGGIPSLGIGLGKNRK